MKTKLVYVLTCAPEKHYIEQALMSVFSARHWNPNAHIVLIVDNLTDQLLVGKRAEVLDYVSEKIVVPFEDSGLSVVYRSRWIKTSVRQLIKGDFLFLDCDTIICKSLGDIDGFQCQIGAVLESHLVVKDYCDSLHKTAVALNARIGVDLDVEGEYFSSGVMYVKDLPETHQFYDLWHQYWLDSCKKGLLIDQPSLAKANREVGHMVCRIPDTYNCILFTMNDFVEKSHILHISAYRNPSYLFTNKVLDMVGELGLTDWIKDAILHPCDTMLPFDYVVRNSSLGMRMKWIYSLSHSIANIRRNLPDLLDEFPMQSSLRGIVICFFRYRCSWSGAVLWMGWKRIQVIGKKDLKDNVCKK